MKSAQLHVPTIYILDSDRKIFISKFMNSKARTNMFNRIQCLKLYPTLSYFIHFPQMENFRRKDRNYFRSKSREVKGNQLMGKRKSTTENKVKEDALLVLFSLPFQLYFTSTFKNKLINHQSFIPYAITNIEIEDHDEEWSGKYQMEENKFCCEGKNKHRHSHQMKYESYLTILILLLPVLHTSNFRQMLLTMDRTKHPTFLNS
ncbi:unnamed protein product [Brugia pahangi]|uniref:Uncharacterized protein n=1 Tax=Brugia pahangi TaxID=6280 RepID=A0A0N4TR65_BRUPA|nr:unnamed protein product [Brugia pahangi]